MDLLIFVRLEVKGWAYVINALILRHIHILSQRLNPNNAYKQKN